MHDTMTESEYLQMWEEYDDDDYFETQDEEIRLNVGNISARIQKMKTIYETNRNAKVGTTLECPCLCGKKFEKRSYQHCFRRNKGASNCKDKYWNWVKDSRRFRMAVFSGKLDEINNDELESNNKTYWNEVLDINADSIQPINNKVEEMRKLAIDKVSNADEKTLTVILSVLSL